MSADLEAKLNDTWYGGTPPSLLLRALTPVYRAGFAIDRWWKRRHRCEDLAGRCIVVVGNLTVGGSGKTPLVIRLCELLSRAGLAVGVASRGYGRSGAGLHRVQAGSDLGQSGDEPLLIAQRTRLPVVVAADRCAAARDLFDRGADVVICDDGLQHHRLPRSIEICVIDGSRGFGNGRLLPAGPLREPLSRLRTVDHIVVNGEEASDLADLPSQGMSVVTGMLRSLDEGMGWRLSQFKGCTVQAVAGIANPSRFFELLRQSGIKVIEFPFPDHHAFKREDFDSMNTDLPILMTEKDSMKCSGLGLKNAWYLAVDAVLPTPWETALVEDVKARVASASKAR